jgi:hypothetical protein
VKRGRGIVAKVGNVFGGRKGTMMDETFHEFGDVLDRIVQEQEAALAAEGDAAATELRPVS